MRMTRYRIILKSALLQKMRYLGYNVPFAGDERARLCRSCDGLDGRGQDVPVDNSGDVSSMDPTPGRRPSC